MTENIVTGKKYRILTDAAQDTWDRISLWTKASDVYYNDNSTAEANRPINILKRSTAYAVGTVAYETTAPSWVMLRCTTAGTTAASTPSTYQTISSVGTTITDGTAKFTVYDVRPTTTLSSSAYLTPAVSLVNNLNSELTANGNKFYFDYQGGKYGFNTSSSRASGTFVPFGGTNSVVYLGEETLFDVSNYKGYQSFTVNDFIVEINDATASNYNRGSVKYSGDASNNITCYGILVKRYDASLGRLTSWFNLSGECQREGDPILRCGTDVRVKAYLILK